MRDYLACLSPMIINSVFSGLSLSFTPAIQFWTHVRHSVSSAKLESKFLWSSARYIWKGTFSINYRPFICLTLYTMDIINKLLLNIRNVNIANNMADLGVLEK